jgi:hypothetical protein
VQQVPETPNKARLLYLVAELLFLDNLILCSIGVAQVLQFIIPAFSNSLATYAH